MNLIGKTIHTQYGKGIVIRYTDNPNFQFIIQTSNQKVPVPIGADYEVENNEKGETNVN